MGPEKCSNNIAFLFFFFNSCFCCLLYLTNSTINSHPLAKTGHENKDANAALFGQHKQGCHGNEALKTKHALQEVASWHIGAICIMSVQNRMESQKTKLTIKEEKQTHMDQFKNILSKTFIYMYH